MSTLSAPPAVRPRGHRTGAPLLPPVLSYAVLTVLAAVLPAAIAGEAPWSSDAALLDFFTHHRDAAHAGAFLTAGAAIPFAVLTAVATTRLRTLGYDVPGRMIAQIGGTIAAGLLTLAGLCELAITAPHVSDSPAAIRSLEALSVAAGGPGFVGFAGLLVAGPAIPCLLDNLIARPLAWTGLVVAGMCELAALAIAFPGLDVLVPIGRFGSLAWLVVLGFVLPADRRDRRVRRGIVRAADLA
jgi:hypothetical protein